MTMSDFHDAGYDTVHAAALVAWDAGLIRLIMATEDELAAAVACGSGSADGADSVAQEAGRG